MSRTGRRPGDSGTRQAIADAARHQFGREGYAGTTIRSIADEAGVDPALVMHFFGSKEQLFAASVEWPFDPARELAAVIGDEPGRRLTRLFVTTWDADEGRNPIVALLQAAMSQPAAGRHLREFLEQQMLLPLLTALGSDEPGLRASLVASHLIGLGIARYVLRFEPLASLPPERVVDLIGPIVQESLTGRRS